MQTKTITVAVGSTNKTKIHHLPKDVIAKIAAGEVIERPAYAVKELIENALDAKADSVAIHIEESGLRKIIVTDNGEGMDKEDLEECFKPHTTSKLQTAEQLSYIHTFGFRGEALASIAAISNVTIQSKTEKAISGTSIEITDSVVKKISPIGMPGGTTMTVADLFHSVPGRKQFLKSYRTELRHIIAVITSFAFANSAVHFVLTHNKKIIFDLPKKQNLSERIKLLLGTTIFFSLLPVNYEKGALNISGFIAKPQLTTTSNQKQFIYINQRKVSDKFISLAVKDAYGNLLASKTHPIFILFVSLPYEYVDVNVHPRKEEVRFVDAKMVYDSVHAAVSQTLTEKNITYYLREEKGLALSDKITNSFAGRLLKENQIPWDIRAHDKIATTNPVQFHNLYLLTQTKYGIALIDQHGAHERILYEQFMEAFLKQKKELPQYHLSTPKLFDLSFSERELLHEYLPQLEKLGFVIESFKDNSFLLHAMPLVFQDRNPEILFTELLEDLMQKKSFKTIDSLSQKMIAYLACRAAIKAGESLTKKQAKELLEKLEQTNNNATCPHGRPTKIIIAIDQLHRMFKRK